MSYGYGAWKPYVPVATRRAQAAKQAKKLTKAGQVLQPVSLTGRTIANTFWGKGWCKHLEAFSDFENRLPRGRSYVRNGSVCHLAIHAGRVEALVMGSSLYRVTVQTPSLQPAVWAAIKRQCSGEIGSLLELLQGRVSDQVMRVVSARATGLFPQAGQMKFTCSCPDWADMCKHVAAVLYGVGSRLDAQPQLLFLLRDVDPNELISASLNVSTAATSSEGRLADEQLGAIFGIDLEAGDAAAVCPKHDLDNAVARDFRASAKSVAALRKKHRLSVSEFALRLSVSPASVQRWEATRGRLKLHDRCLVALAALQRDVPRAKQDR